MGKEAKWKEGAGGLCEKGKTFYSTLRHSKQTAGISWKILSRETLVQITETMYICTGCLHHMRDIF